MKTLGRLSKEHYFSEFNQEIDAKASIRLRVQAKRLYE